MAGRGGDGREEEVMAGGRGGCQGLAGLTKGLEEHPSNALWAALCPLQLGSPGTLPQLGPCSPFSTSLS